MKQKKVLFKAGILLFSLLLLLGVAGCGAISNLMATPTPTATATPTATLTPTPTPVPVVAGQVVFSPEFNLEGSVLIVLCQETSTNVCVVRRDMSTITDNDQRFGFHDVPPGKYYVLYNPFPIVNTTSYWEYWENRTLDFTSPRTLGDSLGGDIRATAAIDGLTGDLIVRLVDYPMVIELLSSEQGKPLSIRVVPGQSTDVTINARAFNP